PRLRNLDALAHQGDLKIVVLRAGCSYRQRLEEILAKRGIVGLRRLEFGTIDGIVGCVAAGLRVTLFARRGVSTAVVERRIAIHALPANEAQVDTLFVRRRDALASSALTAFLQSARPLPAQAAE